MKLILWGAPLASCRGGNKSRPLYYCNHHNHRAQSADTTLLTSKSKFVINVQMKGWVKFKKENCRKSCNSLYFFLIFSWPNVMLVLWVETFPDLLLISVWREEVLWTWLPCSLCSMLWKMWYVAFINSLPFAMLTNLGNFYPSYLSFSIQQVIHYMV